MKNFRISSPSSFGVFAALALSWLPATESHAQGPIPAGDLTVTVEEQQNGDVKFSLSGTAYMQSSGSFSYTNISFSAGTPPNAAFGSYGLPAGLKLTVPDRTGADSSEESPEELPSPPRDLLIGNLYGSSGWFLGLFDSGTLLRGDSITGAGSVTTNAVPFSFFVPGTYQINPGAPGSEPEASAGEVAEAETGFSPYSITYKVIPFAENPDLRISSPAPFPRTRLRRSGGSQDVTISNRGNVTIQNLTVEITGAGSGDFSHSRPSVSELAPGASTRISVGFKPLRRGVRIAKLVVNGAYLPPPPAFTAEPEEGELPTPDPVAVSASVKLEGTGVAPKRKPKPEPNPKTLVPRFPRGIY
jgi:hypothetical protein